MESPPQSSLRPYPAPAPWDSAEPLHPPTCPAEFNDGAFTAVSPECSIWNSSVRWPGTESDSPGVAAGLKILTGEPGDSKVQRRCCSYFESNCYLVAKPCLILLWPPWFVARQAPRSIGFPKQEYWSGLHFLLQGIFLTQGSILRLLHWQGDSLSPRPPGSPPWI